MNKDSFGQSFFINYITTFVITANFVITSIRSAQKSADRVFFHRQSHVILQENIRFGYSLESPRPGDSYKYRKRTIYKRTVPPFQTQGTLGAFLSCICCKIHLISGV